MKRIYISNQSQQKLGGGFVFLDNFKKGCQGKAKIVDSWKECDTVFVAGITMTTREEIREAKENKKKIIVRIDNMPKDSRNRGTAFSKMKDFSIMADWIVFQSQWAKFYVGEWLKYKFKLDLDKKSNVIYNGVDREFFYHKDDPSKRNETFLYCTFNTDENKRFPEAAYDFYLKNMEAVKNNKQKPKLKLVGNFSDGLKQYKFDFFNDEDITYYPPISDRKQLADIYRSSKYLYFPAFADASPNTVGEAVSCGCEVLLMNPIGGTLEVYQEYKKKPISIQEMAEKYLEVM